MNHYIAYIRAAAQTWCAYKVWVCGDPKIRGWEMHRAMRDIQMCAVLYRVEAKKRRALMP